MAHVVESALLGEAGQSSISVDKQAMARADGDREAAFRLLIARSFQ